MKKDIKKLRGQDLNLRPSGYEPDELPDCSTPRYLIMCITLIKLSFVVKLSAFSGSNNYYAVDGEGFEPSKALPTDLQSVPFGHSGNHPYYILFSFYCFMQADDRTRTDNLLITNQLLCQLSHIGI